MNIQYLKDYEDHKEGDVVDHDEDEAKALCKLGFAKEVEDEKDEDQTDEANDEKTQKVLKTFQNSVDKKLDGITKGFKKEIIEDVTKAIEKKMHNFAVAADPLEKNFGFKSYGDLAASVYMENKNEDHKNRMKTYRAKIANVNTKASYMNTSDDPVFVPHQFADTLWASTPEYPKYYTEGIPLRTDSLNFDAPFIDDTSRSSEQVGGFTLSWTAEYNQLSLTKPTTNKSQLKLKKLTGFYQVTAEEQKTPYNIGAIIDQVAAPAFVNKLNSARLFGAGTTEPIGQLTANNGNLYTVPRAVKNKITYPDLLKMDAASNDMNTGAKFIWLYSPSVESSLFACKFPDDNGSVQAFMPQNGYINSAAYGISQMPILGKAAYKCVNMKYLGFKGDIALVNLNKFYTLRPMQDNVQVDTSMHLLFDRATDTVRWITWFDCGPCQTSYLTLSDGTSVVSDAIVLSTYT